MSILHDLLDLCLVAPRGAKGCNHTPPSDSVLGHLLDLGPGPSGCLHFCLYASSPSPFWSSNFSGPQWVPVERLSCDILLWFSQCMSNPAPFSFLYINFYLYLFCFIPYILHSTRKLHSLSVTKPSN
jgi:hypothetical protein